MAMDRYSPKEPNDELCQRLREVQLEESYWFEVLEKELGVKSAKAFRYVGQESYQLLVHFVREPWEKRALYKLLNMETKLSFNEYGIKRREMLVQRQKELATIVKSLWDLTKLGKTREDEEVHEYEGEFRELLQIPENYWISDKENLIDATKKMEEMCKNIEVALRDETNWCDASYMLKTSGALKGVWVGAHSNTSAATCDMLRVPEVMHLGFPLLPPYVEQKQFKFKTEEENFLKEAEMLNDRAQNGMSSVTGGHIDKENREDRAEGTGKRREVDVKEASEENSEDPKLRGEREEEGSIVQEVEGEYYGEREVTKVESMKGGAVHKSEEQEVEERVGIIEEVEATENGKSEESATENVEGEHYHEESNETKVEGNMNEVEVVVPEARERGSEIVLHGEGKVLELKAERKVNAIDHGKQHEEVPKVMGRRGDFEDREVTREEGIKKAVKGEGQEVQERVETSAENERDENGLETMKGVIEGEEVKTAAVLTEGNNKETESIVKANNMNVCTKEEEAVNKGEEREEENVAVQCHDCKGGKNTGDKEIGEPKVEEKVGEGESVVQEETEGGSEKVPEEGGKVPELKAEREVQGAEHATQHEKVQEVKQISGNEESEATRAASMKGGVVKGEQSVEERVEIYVRGVEGAIEEKLQRQSEEGQGNSADVVTVRGSVREGGEDRSVPEADGINGSRKEDELEASNRKVEERAKDNIEAKNDHEGSTKRGVDKEIGGGTVAAEGGSDKVAEKDEKVPELKAEREEKRAEHIRQCQEVQKVKEVVGAAVDYEVRKETKAESMTVAVPKGKGEEDIEKRVEITVKKRDEKVVESMKGARLKTESEQQENGAAVVTQRDSDTVRKSEDSVAESDGSRKEDELESTANGKVEVRGKNVEGEHDHEGSTDERGVDKEIGVGVEAEVTEATEQGSEKVLEEDRKVPKSKAEREVKGAAHIRQYQEIQEVKGITVDFEDGKETRAESMKVAVPNVNCEQVIEERVELTVENERDDNVLENMEGVIEGGESDESVKEKQNRESKHDCVTYLSTVRYYFLPMASCFLVNDNLQLSDDALSHLGTIDTAIMQKKPVEDMCKLFFGRFGSHIFRGPLHFGGKLMWKCSNKGYKDAENQPIQELQMKVIDRMVTMQLDACYTETCVSSNDRNFANFPECLVGSTFVQVIVTGTSLKFIGLPDWKNCLLGSSKEWSLIDHGISPVPVWEIILMNHQTQFRNSSTLAKVLENTWEKTNNADLNAPMKVHFERVMNQGEEVSSIEEFVTKLKSLLQIKESLLQSFLDPGLWAAKYITEPCFRNFICVNVNSCINRGDNLANARELLQNLVDPVDLGITDIFSTEQHVLRSIYDRDELPLPILSEHLCTWMERIFKIALNSMCSSAESMEVKERTESPVYPQRALRGTVLIECAVHVLRNHLVKTGQCCLECLLVTLLYPFEFDPVQQKFLVLLTRSDISYLSANFAIMAKYFFCQTHEINAQAYLFYLIISASDKITVRQECVIANIEYLKKKMTLCPELQTHLENLTSYKITLKQFQNEMETLFQKEEITPTATDENKEIVSKVTVTNLQSKQESLFQRLGLHEYFPQKLSLDDARGLREDILKVLHPELCVEKPSSDAVEKGDKHTSDAEEKSSDLNNICSDPTDKLSSDQALYPFILLQQIMVFDHRWTTRSKSLSTNSFSGSNSEDSDSDSDSEGPDSDIHPLDCLLALLHCCDNFLRQDLLKRLATCQLAVPLLLPHPFTQEPTLLLWALRSIVKEFKLHDDTPFCGPIVTSPIPYVSFLRIGHHFRSKSEILCNVINSSDNKRDIFLNYNSRGGTRRKLLVEGLVDMSWYLPSKSSDDLFPNAVGFVNLHGDAFSSDLKEQINVVCNVCTMHVVLLRDSMLEEDATRQNTIELLNQLSLAKGGVIILQNKPREGLATYFDLQQLKKQFTIIRMNRHKGIADIGDKIRGKICRKLEASSISLEDVIHKCKIGINIDEDNADCMKGRELAEELFSVMDAYLREHPEGSPKKLLTLQSAELWHAWADADKEQYRMKRKPHGMTIDDYGSSRRKYMDEVRKKQYERAKTLFALKEKMEQAPPEAMVISFLTTLKTCKGNVLWYYLLWLKSKLDDLSRKLLPQLHKKYFEKRNKLSNIQNID